MAAKTVTALEAAEPLDGAELVEISQLSPTVAITATTISALNSDQSFNDSADGLVAAGFAANQRVNVIGFTGDTANNLFVGVVTDLTAGKMTIGGVDGAVIVDDAAGESVTITKWESRRCTAQDIADLSGGSVTQLYDFGFVFEATPGADAIVGRVRIGRDITIPANMAGSSGGVGVNATATFDIDVQDDGVSIGTISVSTGGALTFTTDSGTSKAVADGSEITFIAPTTPDATVEAMSAVIQATVD